MRDEKINGQERKNGSKKDYYDTVIIILFADFSFKKSDSLCYLGWNFPFVSGYLFTELLGAFGKYNYCSC